MIKVLADKVLAFDRGEIDGRGQLVVYKTQIGFCELPDWVAEHDYYKMAVADGSLKAFVSSGDSEAVLKAAEREAALQLRIKELEEQNELLSSKKKNKKGAVDSDGGTGDGEPQNDNPKE